MSKIAFLGLGAMGSRMAAHLLGAGHQVTVWNRNKAKSQALGQAGAEVAASPRAAAGGAEFIIAMVRDDAASRQVWLDEAEGALPAIRPDAIAIECSTVSLEWVKELSARCAARGHAFLDAPVVGSRPQAEQRQLIFLAGGQAEVVARAEPILSVMGSIVHHAGSSGAGAAVKLAVNTLFGVQVGVLAEVLEIIRRQGFDPVRAGEIIAATPVCSPAAKGAIGSMLVGAFAPLFPVELVEKDLGYAQVAAGASAMAPLVTTTRAVFAEAIRRGFGNDHLTGLIRLYQQAE